MYSSRRSAAASDTISVASADVLLQQRKLELENYKEEAAARMVAGRYNQAVDMFTKVGATTIRISGLITGHIAFKSEVFHLK